MLNEKEKRDLVGKTVDCPRDVTESGKLYIWGYAPAGGNPNHFQNTEERFHCYNAKLMKNTFDVTLKEFESWQLNK